MESAQRRLLRDAIVSAYPTHDALVMFVELDLGWSFQALVAPGDLEVEAFRLISAAESRGWLHPLTRTLVEGRPDNELVRKFADGYGLRRSINAGLAVPAVAQLFNDAYFDLTSAKDKVHEAMFTAQRGLLGLSITTDEDSVAKRLCAWLPHCLGELQPKDDVSLGAVTADPDHKVKQILQHLPEIEDTSVVCRVLVNDATAAALEQFWEGVRSACGPLGNWFALVFVTPSDDRRAPGVVDLGRPAFQLVDVHKWAIKAAVQLGWPQEVAVPWSRWIQQKAEVSAGQLSVPLTYGALQRSMRGVSRNQNNPDGFLAWLREKA
ncbi:hypothetical protein E0H26_26935 [Micromonospora zingiberis]|uniref:Effector-associated domain-containing protein n=1 Tax=Micromonospora zingiberis TaxID=2053011 RepID=A0A4R0G3J2_9ACTN|nr:effector-associated domain EAD1-containing protein [Micromonospora zingiberis]TCB90462.1 hypothetical protein E0H26_26935 [Micromonospora zingiberis]